jgi:hypothetical protein
LPAAYLLVGVMPEGEAAGAKPRGHLELLAGLLARSLGQG